MDQAVARPAIPVDWLPAGSSRSAGTSLRTSRARDRRGARRGRCPRVRADAQRARGRRAARPSKPLARVALGARPRCRRRDRPVDRRRPQRAIDAGATFLVMPAPGRRARRLGRRLAASRPSPAAPRRPRSSTAWRAGAAAVKLFPASVLGPALRPRAARPASRHPARADRRRDRRDRAGRSSRPEPSAVGMGGWLLGDGDRDGVRERARRSPASSRPPARRAAQTAGRMTEVVTLGECLIAFVATTPGPLADATTFDRFVAGAEANVAVGLARLGHERGVHRPGRWRRLRRRRSVAASAARASTSRT